MTTATTKSQPKVDFSTFILSLASSAMMHLGRIPDPSGGAPEINLEMARQTIDMLTMLRDKTHGNLERPESELLERLLHDVRVAFLEQSRSQAS